MLSRWHSGDLPTGAGNARDTGSIPAQGRCPRVENGNLLQYSCLENSMDRGVWWATVHGAAKIQMQLSMNALNEYF